MPYCLNPSCHKPKNPEGVIFCMNCGESLPLKGIDSDKSDRSSISNQLNRLSTQLKEALDFGQWQEGDRLTNEIILELAHKSKIAELTPNDINQIACKIWIEIDQAWMRTSNNRFGWSAQQQIWKNLGGRLIYEEDVYWKFANAYEKFSDRVGWRKARWLNLALSPKIWRKYENLTFAIAAPIGHLPSLLFWEGFNLVDTVFYRLEICRQSDRG